MQVDLAAITISCGIFSLCTGCSDVKLHFFQNFHPQTRGQPEFQTILQTRHLINGVKEQKCHL